jgi:hypothetical protein
MPFNTKTPAMQSILDTLAFTQYGRYTSSSIENGICVSCGQAAKIFTDTTSKREYEITALCQPCQDQTFSDLEPIVMGESDI